MIATRFRSVTLALACAGAALGCYLVSLRVASERNALERVQRQIASAKSDIRGLTIELSTRGRLGQLEHWNTEVLGLAAPKPAQYLASEVQLASLTRYATPAVQARVIPVSAPVDAPTAPSAVVTASLHAAPPRAEAAVATANHSPHAPRFHPAAPTAAPPSLVHEATFIKPAAPVRTALLDPGMMSELSRAARAEQGGRRR